MRFQMVMRTCVGVERIRKVGEIRIGVCLRDCTTDPNPFGDRCKGFSDLPRFSMPGRLLLSEPAIPKKLHSTPSCRQKLEVMPVSFRVASGIHWIMGGMLVERRGVFLLPTIGRQSLPLVARALKNRCGPSRPKACFVRPRGNALQRNFPQNRKI
jgi:hypothetical protein